MAATQKPVLHHRHLSATCARARQSSPRTKSNNCHYLGDLKDGSPPLILALISHGGIRKILTCTTAFSPGKLEADGQTDRRTRALKARTAIYLPTCTGVRGVPWEREKERVSERDGWKCRRDGKSVNMAAIAGTMARGGWESKPSGTPPRDAKPTFGPKQKSSFPGYRNQCTPLDDTN